MLVVFVFIGVAVFAIFKAMDEKKEFMCAARIGDIETKEMVAQRNRKNQDEFRKCLLAFYNNECIITGNNVSEILQACHILPYSFCQDNCKDKEFDINNGIILESSMHILFDKFYFSINPVTQCIELGNKIKNQYSQYDGMKIKSLNDETLQNMKHHYYVFEKYENNNELNGTNELNRTNELMLESLNNKKLLLTEKEKNVKKTKKTIKTI